MLRWQSVVAFIILRVIVMMIFFLCWLSKHCPIERRTKPYHLMVNQDFAIEMCVLHRKSKFLASSYSHLWNFRMAKLQFISKTMPILSIPTKNEENNILTKATSVFVPISIFDPPLESAYCRDRER